MKTKIKKIIKKRVFGPMTREEAVKIFFENFIADMKNLSKNKYKKASLPLKVKKVR